MKIVTAVISIAIASTDISQMKCKIFSLSIIQPLCCDQFESLDVDRLAEDPLFLANFIVCEDDCNLSSIGIDLAGEACLQFTSESANQIERNKVAVHVVSLVLCCVCHVSIISASLPFVNS